MPEHPTQSLADLLVRESEDIVRQWLARLSDRVTVDERFLFPSEDLLDHVPILLEGMARALVSREPISVDTPVVLKAKELGKLRFDQGFSARQILWEYQLLGGVMLNRLEEVGGYPAGPEGQRVVRRLFDALTAVQRATVEEFLDHYERTIHEREDRLRGFNHALSHELRNEIGAILGAARMLRERFVVESPDDRERFVGMVIDNAERVEHLVGNLLELSRMDADTRRHRNVLLKHAAEEACRSLREFAESREVELRVRDLPDLEVNAAAVELALSNLIANSIKYHHPARDDRWVEVRARVADRDGCVVVEVVDNGRGVPEQDRPRLFERFFRSSDTAADVDGTGLGLHLVQSALHGLNGEVWAEFPDTGETIFAISLPARRSHDSAPGEG